MLRFFIKKLLHGLFMIIGVSIITFALLSAAGGDALSGLRENPQISEQTIDKLRQVYGLDRPFIVRYGSWLGSAAHGDLGESFMFKLPVSALVWARLKNTLMIGLLGLAISVVVSLGLALISARYRSRLLEGAIDIMVLVAASTPRVVLSFIVLVISLRLSIAAPVAGETSPFLLFSGAIVLAIPLISLFLAQAHDGLKEAMNEDFVRLARAKGLSEWTVIAKHAMRVALNPFLTLFGLAFGALLGGSVIVETVLSWPGIGALMVSAVRGRDVPLVMGIVVVASAAVWVGNTLAEVLQVVNDPRIQPHRTK